MTATARAIDHEQQDWCYRMKDLCEATGLPRQAIHFYIQQGLLPPGRKTGRNMAWYTEEHIERLRLIKKLQHEQFLPLKAIKALFDGEDGVFSPRQYAFLAGVKEELAESLKTSEDRRPTLTPEEIADRTGISAWWEALGPTALFELQPPTLGSSRYSGRFARWASPQTSVFA
jgi:DNA-binding transcriptional MerR regulator